MITMLSRYYSDYMLHPEIFPSLIKFAPVNQHSLSDSYGSRASGYTLKAAVTRLPQYRGEFIVAVLTCITSK